MAVVGCNAELVVIPVTFIVSAAVPTPTTTTKSSTSIPPKAFTTIFVSEAPPLDVAIVVAAPTSVTAVITLPSLCAVAVVPPSPLVEIPTALPEIFPTPINSLPIKSNETLAVIPLTFATLTDVAFALSAAPPALSTVVAAVLFRRTNCSPTVNVPWFVPPISLVT